MRPLIVVAVSLAVWAAVAVLVACWHHLVCRARRAAETASRTTVEATEPSQSHLFYRIPAEHMPGEN